VSLAFAGAVAVRDISGVDRMAMPDALLASDEPVVLRGLVADWPLVRAGLDSAESAAAHLSGFYRGAPVAAMIAPATANGRFFYDDALGGFNFQRVQARLDELMGEMLRLRGQAGAPAIYVGATAVDAWLPGWRDANPIGLQARQPLASVWIGNRSRVSAHYDVPDNLACVAVGRRRFTLFPPRQLANLYVGPLDRTPAGQAVSLVDFHAPDLARYPRFARALEEARVVELDPGDALFLPSLWWHHVEALSDFNVLVNYWWRGAAATLESPTNALMLAMMSLRDLPAAQRRAWQEIFRHYVFEAGDDTVAHIPEAARGVLGPLDEAALQALRAQLLSRLGR
jgi:hypothetical protein